MIDEQIEKYVDDIEAALTKQVEEAAQVAAGGDEVRFDTEAIAGPVEALWRESGPYFAGLVFNAIDRARKDFTEEQFSVWEEAVADHIAQKTGEQVVLINDTTREWIQSVISSATAEGMGTDEIVRELRSRWDGLSKTRAGRIAQTEMNAAANWGSLEAGKSAGMTRKEWVTAGDKRVRDQHKPLNGRVIGIDEEFDNGLLYPSEPGKDKPSEVIGCRCQIVFLP